MYFLNITEIAEEDISLAVKYIAHELKAPLAAINLLDEIEKHEGILEMTPNIYPFVHDGYLINFGIKFVVIKNYFMFYFVNEETKTVNVIRLLFGRRDWKNLLKENILN